VNADEEQQQRRRCDAKQASSDGRELRTPMQRGLRTPRRAALHKQPILEHGWCVLTRWRRAQ